MQQLSSRLADWLKERAAAAGAGGAVFGMSGGIDSAVVAVLCRRAFGKSLLGLLLPCHSLPQDMEHASLVAAKFGIPTVTVDIGPAYDALLSALPADTGPNRRLAESNLKPRLRMATMYAFANRLNYLVVGSGNRCELGVGYFTKHGDSGVDVMPLANLVKGQVRDLAGHLGVPREIIEKAPSAGLWAGQTDEGEMGLTYDELDAYFTGREVADAVRRKIEERAARNEHKRSPPPAPPF